MLHRVRRLTSYVQERQKGAILGGHATVCLSCTGVCHSNGENGNFPDNTTLQSNKLIWWCCHECPKGKVHSWQARAFHRTLCKKPTGCPCCVGHQLCECNCLVTVCPDIAADFDVEKNGVTAAEVTSSTHTKYSWLSDEPGAKKRSVAQRTTYTRKQLITDARRS